MKKKLKTTARSIETIENLNLAKDKLKSVVNTLPPSFLDKIFYEYKLDIMIYLKSFTIIFPWSSYLNSFMG